MAKVGGAKGFLNILKSISIAEVAREANRPLSVAVVGTPEARAEAIQALFAPMLPGEPQEPQRPLALPEPPFVQAFDTTSEEAGFPRQPTVFDLVLDLGGGRVDAPEGARIYSLPDLGGWEAALERILDDRPELTLALARNFPIFRRRVAQRIISETAVANAQFSLVTGIAEAIPFTAILLPVNSLSDIIVLTKNQAMMTVRLAAAYGLTVDYKARMKEIAPILGNAFGWRAIARELVGAVPLVGFLVRAMISYAGTVTVGKAAQYYYETGENLTSKQARQLYREAYASSRDRVRQIAETLRNGNGGGGGRVIASPAAEGTPILEAPDKAPRSIEEPLEAAVPAEESALPSQT